MIGAHLNMLCKGLVPYPMHITYSWACPSKTLQSLNVYLVGKKFPKITDSSQKSNEVMEKFPHYRKYPSCYKIKTQYVRTSSRKWKGLREKVICMGKQKGETDGFGWIFHANRKRKTKHKPERIPRKVFLHKTPVARFLPQMMICQRPANYPNVLLSLLIARRTTSSAQFEYL